MENRWNIIVRNLNRSKQKNVDEDTYQDTIECQLQLLGWFDGIESRPSLPNGASKTLIPDIVLNKNNHRVLPIEIKKPTNSINERQASQLSSYMRRLRLPLGLYIGENIQLYYDTPEDDNDAVSVCTIDFEENHPLGKKFCQLLSYENFDLKTLEDFCIEQLRMINARKDFRKRITEYASPQTVAQNILELLREKFIAEGFEENVIDIELEKLHINIKYSPNTPLKETTICKKTLNEENPTVKKLSEVSKKQSSIDCYNSANGPIFIIRNKNGINAKAYYKNGKMIVLRGTIFSSVTHSSFKSHDLRNLVINKSAKQSNGFYYLLEDFSFNAPSSASQVICGASTNGWMVWKTENGKTLREWLEEQHGHLD